MDTFDVAVSGALWSGSGQAYAYVADGGSGPRIVDISDSAHPVEVGSWTMPGPAISVVIRGSYAYVTAGDGGLRVADISDPTAPKEVSYCDTQGWVQEVSLAGDYVYISPTTLADCSSCASAKACGDEALRIHQEFRRMYDPYRLSVVLDFVKVL